jgi:type III restriction enzyme
MSPDAADLSAVGALEPLFGPSEYPSSHRRRGEGKGTALVVSGRRPSPIEIVRRVRSEVDEWRAAGYVGASDTTRTLLQFWFQQNHTVTAADGLEREFAYYFCQQEAVETLAYLYEVRRSRTLSGLVAEFSGRDAEVEALGVAPEDDAWARYAFKIATGAGKTKIMSLVIAWSYFHSVFESDSDLARDFVVIAPGVTVFERLKEDFAPPGGGPNIFDLDPIIPPAWRGEWHMSVVLQGEPSSLDSAGTIYLTNIHRLYETRRPRGGEPDTYDWAGPKINKAGVLDRSRELRDRMAAHQKLLVLNDEAHHVWDPGSAWSKAIGYLHAETLKRGGGVVAQLDLSATPRDDRGRIFRHVVCDTPLGEAVDAGIVKTPVIGRGSRLKERPDDNAAYKFEMHLALGYRRWQASRDEWKATGKKALLFIMTDSTASADQITQRLNTDSAFKELNGKTINLHTNLKGKIKKRGTGKNAYEEFVESEKEISDEDLKALRRLSRDLDDDTSPYVCIVSVLMLREGWDVRNVTTIVPLRPLTAQARILPEQTLGRGLRRMTPPGLDSAAEIVTVIEHPSFISLYENELAQEGLPITAVDPDKLPRLTVSIFPDADNKDLDALDLVIPRLSYAHQVTNELGNISFEEVRERFLPLGPLEIGKGGVRDIKYEGRTLITNELVEQMKVKLPLLESGFGAISYYRELMERACRIKGQHAVIAPLLQRFIEDLLFGRTVALTDPDVVARLGDDDVREYIQAVFIDLIREKTTTTAKRVEERTPQSMTVWRPYAATHSDKRPCEPASRSPFNLVPCSLSLEVAMTHFLEAADEVEAFAKNQGPQALRIDCLSKEGIRSLYTPDFVVRHDSGNYYLIETKGTGFAKDPAVASKAHAAQSWCKAASSSMAKWEYLYVPQQVFNAFQGDSVTELAGACKPALVRLLKDAESPQLTLGLDALAPDTPIESFVSSTAFDALGSADRNAVVQAIQLFDFMAGKPDALLAPVFQPLLGRIDHAAENVVLDVLESAVPPDPQQHDEFFGLSGNKFLGERCRSLRRMLVTRSPIMPTGVLLFCLEYAGKDKEAPNGILGAVRERFSDLAGTELHMVLQTQYDFRNEYIAHEKREPLRSAELAREALGTWVDVLVKLRGCVESREPAPPAPVP